MILAHRFPGTDEGSLTFIGLRPEQRGRGLGRPSHACALALLRWLGVNRYTCSTEPSNAAMLSVYRANGCAVMGTSRHHKIL